MGRCRGGVEGLALSIVALILAFVVPGIGLILGWMIAAYAIGRGLFVAVAMRRMPRLMAELLYRQCRGIVFWRKVGFWLWLLTFRS